MATRRDQLQSYQFLLQRVISALVYRKTDPAQSPFRKAGGAVFAGVMLSILALAATAAIGLFVDSFGASDTWTEGNAIVIDEDTGAIYVVYPPKDQVDELGIPQRLYPVLNYTSAVLLAGGTTSVSVDRADLTENDVPERGMPIGIPNAPTSLPESDYLLTGGWSVCSLGKADAAGKITPISYAFVGSRPDNGTVLADDETFIASDEKDNQYLIWNNHKFALNGDAARKAFRADGETAVSVDSAYLTAIPNGQKLKPPRVKGVGEPTPAGADLVAGTVIQVGEGADASYYVATSDGAAQITHLQALLLLSDQQIKDEAYQGRNPEFVSMTTAPTTTANLRPDPNNPQHLPESVPGYVDAGAKDTATCALYNRKGDNDGITIGVHIDAIGIDTEQVSREGLVYADKVVVPPGRAALVQSGTPQADGGALLLVTDGGRSFPLESVDLAGVFGYPLSKAVHVYSNLVGLIPQGLPDGMALSVTAARTGLQSDQ